MGNLSFDPNIVIPPSKRKLPDFLSENHLSANADLLSIKLLGKVVILTGLDGDSGLYEMSYSLQQHLIR